ncbi:uncharacterized protein FIBRA_02172 [Fibroporia radiculosa]|uniref:DUF6534 domain-containing protein n=1 Tax=Fibroporia radiculosa TaxID=599839 RepID=J4GMK4_9APHY|nr:uncharacterized protein FIBRA_02172 [Fibroporia radiculosa]CCM00145.1 predicted protein [Fibroporia radiculosa]
MSSFQVTPSNLTGSLGGLLIGGLAATALSGVVVMQTILYFRIFERDESGLKLVVGAICFLDILHTCMVWAADWMYMVDSFGNMNITNHVFWPAGVTIALTAATTVTVHLFFSYRLFRLSKGNYFITLPLVLLALARFASATATSIELFVHLLVPEFPGPHHDVFRIKLGQFSEFYAHFRWLFTLGLSLSTAVDVMITFSLCTYLRRSRRGGTGRLDNILDSMTLYTIENGMATCIATAISLVFWLVKPHELVYLGLHFAISKLYSNSFLASMNARKLLRAQHVSNSESGGHGFPASLSNRFSRRHRQSVQETVDLSGTKMQITVDKTVDYVIDNPLPSPTSHQEMSDIKSHPHAV